ncbi:MAG TPA: dioxygenase [Acidimicrobiales bacterium]|nr:dioxygenase [Acidimicrobiales bacterium]
MSENISPSEHLAQVQETFEGGDARTTEIMRAALKHLHAFVEEVGLTREEWFAGIQFLTAVGQKCDDVRQEFILLSDTLGVSMLVEMLNHAAADGTTEPTVFGPFHVDGAPAKEFGGSIVSDDDGEPLVLRGTVSNLDGEPIAGASLDVWEVGSNGLYDVQDPNRGLDLRGVFTTDDQGRYEIRTVRPVDYTIPDDGPVGQMLRATGRHPWRPAHVHVVASAPGYKPVTTHAFDAASGYLDSDAVFGVRRSLIIDMDGGEAEFNVVLDRA